jgi:hypothetical protein
MAYIARHSLRLSNLPRDVEALFVRAFVGGFVQNVIHLELLQSETQDTQALITVECSDRELDLLQQTVQRGCFGRTDVQCQVEQQNAPPQDRSLFQHDDNDLAETMNAMQSLTFTSDDTDWNDRKSVAKEFHTFLYQQQNADLLTRASDREVLGKIFADWMRRDKGRVDWNDKQIKRTAAGVMAALRDLKLLKTQRYQETVICSFAGARETLHP